MSFCVFSLLKNITTHYDYTRIFIRYMKMIKQKMYAYRVSYCSCI